MCAPPHLSSVNKGKNDVTTTENRQVQNQQGRLWPKPAIDRLWPSRIISGSGIFSDVNWFYFCKFPSVSIETPKFPPKDPHITLSSNSRPFRVDLIGNFLNKWKMTGMTDCRFWDQTEIPRLLPRDTCSSYSLWGGQLKLWGPEAHPPAEERRVVSTTVSKDPRPSGEQRPQ